MIVLCALGLAPGVAAQTAAADSTRVYPSDYFTPFAPQTALDMVRRTPGFVLQEGDQDLRGFGAAAGNVLIDGARPSTKGGVEDALSRIAASQVVRIEVIRDAATAEAQGQALVLNVVRAPGATAGAWSLEVERNANGVIYPRVQISQTRDIAGWRTSVRANAYWEEFPYRTLRVSRGADGELISSTVVDLPSTLSEAYLSGDAQRPFAGGVLNLTGRFGWYNYYYDQPGETYIGRLPDGTPDQRLLTQQDIERWIYEFGVDYSRALGDWTLKSVGLVNYRDGGESSRERRDTATGVLLSRTISDSTSKPLELVGRTTFARNGQGALRPELGAEIAYNRFDRTFELAEDEGAGLVSVAIPSANVRVEELRGEVFANLVWSLSRRWTIEGGLAAEASEITVSGDAAQSQSFGFLKPSLALVWRPTDRLQLRTGFRRTVGQLDFEDFAATAELNDGTATAGNPDLGPDQSTRWFLAGDYRGAGDLAINLEVFYEDRQDVLEQVILASGAPGTANAGDGTYYGLKATATMPLDRLLPGARLTLDGEVVDSRFDDPLTGEVRPLSDVNSPDVELEFRHDPPGRRFAWGVTWQSDEEGTLYLVDEIDSSRTRDYFGAFVETTALRGLRARLAVRNADTLRERRQRRFFDPDRSGELSRVEDRFIKSPAFVTLTLSGSF